MKPNPASVLLEQLQYLQLPFIKSQHTDLAREAGRQNWDHQEYLRRLIDGEYCERRQKSIQRRIKAARIPVVKTLEQFLWDWPTKINRLQVQNLFRLEFIAQKANVVFLGTAGLGIMPGTGLCRAVCDLPQNTGLRRLSARHNPAWHFGGGAFAI